MVNQSISIDKYKALKKYKELSAKVRALETERKAILKDIFEKVPSKEESVKLAVRGEGIAFVATRKNRESVGWKALAEDQLTQDDIAELKPEFTKDSFTYSTNF